MSEFSLKALFGVDASPMDAGLGDAQKKTESFADRVSEKVADKLTGMRDISNAIATALGINYEKIADNVARFVTGMSEKEEEALKSLVESSDKATELLMKQLEKRRSIQGNINHDADEEVRIRRDLAKNLEQQATLQGIINNGIQGIPKILEGAVSKLVEFGVKQTALKEQTLLIAKAEELRVQLQELGGKKAELITKQTEDTAKAQDSIRAAMTETLPLQMQLVEHKKLALKYEKEMHDIHIIGAERDKASAKLDEERLAIVKIQAQIDKERYATQEKLFQLKFDQLPIEKKIQTYNENIEVLTKAIAQNKREHKNSDELQVELLTTKVEREKLIKEQTEKRLELEKQNTAELQRQAEAEAAKLRAAQMFVSVTRVGSSYESQSTDALRGTEQRLQQQLGGVGSNGMPLAMATAQNDYGSWLQRTTYENELANVRRELSQRADIQAYAKRYGESAARMQYGDDKTNNALRDMQSSTTRTAVATETLAEQIAALNRKLGINPTG